MFVINKKKDILPRDAIYIGRGSILGNPYPINVDADRETVIALYDEYLEKEIKARNPLILYALRQLKEDSVLMCYCSPLPCRGQVIERLWTQYIKPELNTPNERSLFYAGIGSRSTPDSDLAYMTKLAIRLDELEYTLRSGGALGADSAFEAGATHKDIYIPWLGYNDNNSALNSVSSIALRLAEQLHPAWPNLSQGVKKLMARNCYQVLGEDLKTPADFIICWTPDGAQTAQERTQKTGGTGLAIELADSFGIPVFNLKNHDVIERLSAFIKMNPGYAERNRMR